jgi:hypothetical protein
MNEEIFENFGERIKRINPFFLLGSGMQVGAKLQSYLPNILLMTLLEIFYRELKDDENRTRADIIQIVTGIIGRLKLPADENQVERVVSGLLWSGASDRRDPFSAPMYDENDGMFKEHRFFYLTHDRDYINVSRAGTIVYKLTEESQNIIFFSREIHDEFSIEIEQLYTIQLIKKGNFKSAANSLDLLIARVKRLIQKERDYHLELVRNPKAVLEQSSQTRKDSDEAIRHQFREEKENFERMTRMLNKIKAASDVSDENKHMLFQLHQKIQKTSRYHEILANEVYGNVAYEIQIRKNKPSLFMTRKKASFREDLWEKEILVNGIPDEHVLEMILQPLFSPKADFVYPVSWIWAEQSIGEEIDEVVEEDETKEQVNQYKKEINWQSLIEVWEPIMDSLIQKGVYALSDQKTLQNWNKEAVDLWMMFKSTELQVPQFIKAYGQQDERLVLLQHLIDIKPDYSFFENKVIYAENNDEQPFLTFKGLKISPFILRVSEKEG